MFSESVFVQKEKNSSWDVRSFIQNPYPSQQNIKCENDIIQFLNILANFELFENCI